MIRALTLFNGGDDIDWLLLAIVIGLLKIAMG